MKICFDMDGVLVDLYSVNNWLEKLRAEKTEPYLAAEPMCKLCNLARKLNMLQAQGNQLAIISWTSKCGTPKYNEQVKLAKIFWLAQHLPSVRWDFIHIVEYGTPKNIFKENPEDILFDDESHNRDNWGENAFSPDEIMKVLKTL